MSDTWTVKDGDTLVTIAADVYGDADMWHELAELNQIRDPLYVQTGEVILLP